MRQVFSSPRLENVERVAQLLSDAGIETRITHGRSYKGGLRGAFSYRDHAREQPMPAVWIVKAEDQTRGRELLRAAGLIETTRVASDSFVPPTLHDRREEAKRDPGARRTLRLKLGLLVVIAIVIAMAYMSLRKPRPAVVVQPVAAVRLAIRPAVPRGPAATPIKLAAAVLVGELPVRAGQTACIAIDGGDPSAALLQSLPRTPGTVLPLTRCVLTANGTVLSIGNYRPRAGSAAGTIELQRQHGGRAVTQRYDVNPHDGDWVVVAPYR